MSAMRSSGISCGKTRYLSGWVSNRRLHDRWILAKVAEATVAVRHLAEMPSGS